MSDRSDESDRLNRLSIHQRQRLGGVSNYIDRQDMQDSPRNLSCLSGISMLKILTRKRETAKSNKSIKAEAVALGIIFLIYVSLFATRVFNVD